MSDDKEIFLIDTNALVTPYHQYYAFDLVPTYWDKLRQPIKEGRIVMLDTVKREIEAGTDNLSEWIRDVEGLKVIPTNEQEILDGYAEVLNYLAECGLYKINALEEWSKSWIADPWLIAVGMTHNYTIVTFEQKSHGISIKNPNKNAKIPDVADAFGVKWVNLFEMMRRVGISI